MRTANQTSVDTHTVVDTAFDGATVDGVKRTPQLLQKVEFAAISVDVGYVPKVHIVEVLLLLLEWR